MAYRKTPTNADIVTVSTVPHAAHGQCGASNRVGGGVGSRNLVYMIDARHQCVSFGLTCSWPSDQF